jgi:hypothetical protein
MAVTGGMEGKIKEGLGRLYVSVCVDGYSHVWCSLCSDTA